MKSTARRRGGPRSTAGTQPTAKDTQALLPHAVATAWGLKAAALRPRKHGLSLARIVEAGIRVATIDGLAAVSMNRVAAELGAATMSLYRHVAAKDELLAHMVDAAFADAPPALDPGATWRAGLEGWAAAHLAVLRRHPWLVRVPISGPPSMPNQVLWFERGLACLHGTGLAEAEKPSVLLLVDGFVRGRATLEADLSIAVRMTGVPPERVGDGYSQLLARVTDPQRFPAIDALLRAKVFGGDGALADDFRFGIDRILDGVAVLIATRVDGAAHGE